MRNVIWQPNPGPQTEFHRRGEYEVLYGGAAGGGKSDALLIEALRQVHVPGYKGILFRRSFPEAEELIAKSMLYYPRIFPQAQWIRSRKEWRFPSGASIRFGYLKSLGDELNYQGHEYQYIAFDELTHFPESQYLYLFSRCRTSNPALRCYIRAATNPGGPGHLWVKRRFVDCAPPRETFRDPSTGLTRAFIPARLQDNPKLLEVDPEYVSRLMILPDAQRKALLEGDWDAFEGMVFSEWSKERHVIKPFDIPPTWHKWRGLDWGFEAPYACLWMACNNDGQVIVYRELYGMQDGKPNQGTRETAQEVAARIRAIELAAGEEIYGRADPSIWASSGHQGPTIYESFASEGVHFQKADHRPGSRLHGKMQIHQRLRGWRYGTPEWKPALLIFDTCSHLIRTLPALPPDPHRPEDIDTKAEDHVYDALRYGLEERPWTPPQEVSPNRDGWADIWDDHKGGDAAWQAV
jgi:hypothetical protein